MVLRTTGRSVAARRRSPVPLLSPALRPSALALTGLAAGAVGALAMHYAGHSRAGPLDNALDTRLAYRLADHQGLLDRLVLLGNPVTVSAVTVLLGVVAAHVRPGRAVALCLLGPPLAGGLTEEVLKPLVDRTKGSGLAFPSGHTTGAFSLALVAAVLLLAPGPQPLPAPVRALLGLGGLGLAGGTATAMVALRYHYATDTIGGVGVALAVVLGLALALDAGCDAAARRTHDRIPHRH